MVPPGYRCVRCVRGGQEVSVELSRSLVDGGELCPDCPAIGSGGGRRSPLCLENAPDAFDGALPFMGGGNIMPEIIHDACARLFEPARDEPGH